MGYFSDLDLIRVEEFSEIVDKLKSLYVEKNRRYDDAFHKQYTEMGIQSAIMRLNDKMLRLKTVSKTANDFGDETLEDTLKDLANYSIMTLMELERLNTKNESEVDCFEQEKPKTF